MWKMAVLRKLRDKNRSNHQKLKKKHHKSYHFLLHSTGQNGVEDKTKPHPDKDQYLSHNFPMILNQQPSNTHFFSTKTPEWEYQFLKRGSIYWNFDCKEKGFLSNRKEAFLFLFSSYLQKQKLSPIPLPSTKCRHLLNHTFPLLLPLVNSHRLSPRPLVAQREGRWNKSFERER